MTEIRLYDGPEDEVFQPNPDDYEEHVLTGDSIRGVTGQTVMIHKNDLAILRKNKLIAPLESEQEQEQPATTKRKGGKAQPKAEIAPEPEKAEAVPEPEKAEAVADLPAVPNIADLPGV